MYRAREVQTEDETRHPPSIFSSSTPIPSTRAEQRLGRGRFLQVRFVWVSTMRGWRGFSLFSSRPPSPFLSPGAAWFPISCSNDDAIYGEIKTRELGSFRPLFYSSSTFPLRRNLIILLAISSSLYRHVEIRCFLLDSKRFSIFSTEKEKKIREYG